MSNVTIRRLKNGELNDTIYALGAYAFEPSPPLISRDVWLPWTASHEGLTYYALFEDGVAASGAAATAMPQNVRGAIYPAHGFWAVATGPAYRRRGYTRRVLGEMLQALSDEGDAFAMLYPFKESFYERLGFVAWALPSTASLAMPALASLVALDLGGHVEFRSLTEGYDAYRTYLLRLRERTHGMGVFQYVYPAIVAHDPPWLALARVDGEVRGVMLYRLRGEPDRPFTLHASRFYYDSGQARYLLLQWVARHVDQVETVRIQLAPSERPETWLADLHVQSQNDDRTPMGRVLNVARIGGMEVGPGDFTAEILDPLCPWNQGVWRFASQDGRLQVMPGQQPASRLTIQGLSALVYGTNDPGDFAVRGWGEPAPDLQSTLRAMFPVLPAHLHERF